MNKFTSAQAAKNRLAFFFIPVVIPLPIGRFHRYIPMGVEDEH